MSVIQVCTSGYIISRCRCPQDHGKAVTVKCTEECAMLYHRKENKKTEELGLEELSERVDKLIEMIQDIKDKLPDA